MDFHLKRAVITGAASGVGRAIAEELARRGARVLLADVNEALLAEVAKGIGEAAQVQLCDVADHAQVVALAESCTARLGGCDLVFANAGVITSGKLIDTKPAEVDWILGVNVRGAWNTASVFAQAMIAQGTPAHLVFTGSEHSLGFPHPGAGIYTASKHAVLALAEALRAELPETIKVHMYCPGLVATALGSGERPAGLPLSPLKAEGSRAVHAHGMDADVAAAMALDGVARGDFYIVTHPHSWGPVERRYQEIKAAYEAQAPWFEGAEKWDVNRVMQQVAAETRKPAS